MTQLAIRLSKHVAGRVTLAAATMSATLVCYIFLNYVLPPRFDLLLPVDRMIPFWPWTVLIYQSFYVMPLWAAWVLSPGDFRRLLSAVLAANFVCYIGFVALTAHYPRPDPTMVSSPVWRSLLAAQFDLDSPGNTFPSLHVALSALVGERLWRSHGSILWVLWAAIICISTLTVKQHFVLDVVGGLAVAAAMRAAFFGRHEREIAAPP